MIDTQKTHPAERRRHARAPLEGLFQAVRLDPDGANIMDSLEGIDISRSGLGAVSSRPYYPGQRMVVAVPMTEHTGNRNIYATIVRAKKHGAKYEIGVEFDTAASDAWCGVSCHAAA